MQIEAGTITPCIVTRHGIALFAGTHTACQRFIDEQIGAARLTGFEWQMHGSSQRYVKNGIVLARYWLNPQRKWQIAILLPLKGITESKFDLAIDARQTIETKVAEWFEQVLK